MPRLITSDDDDLHILSLLVRERLRRALETVDGRNIARRLRGRVRLTAGEMETFVVLEGRTIQLEQENTAQREHASASGTLASFFAICQGKIRAMDILRRQVRVSGNLLLLRRFLPLLSTENSNEPEEHND